MGASNHISPPERVQRFFFQMLKPVNSPSDLVEGKPESFFFFFLRKEVDSRGERFLAAR